MSRGRNQRQRRDQFGGELEEFGRGRDPFAEMHQIMRSFGGGFGGFDDFFGRDRMRDPFEQMMQFSDAHKKLHGAGNGGSFVSQTYVSSSTMGQDGRIKKQSYFQNSAGQNQGGHTISQKHQAYKNSDGIKRIAEERMLNDQGRKLIKEKRGNNEVEETNHYYNMDQEDVERFDNNWHGANREMKFLENAQRAMQQGLTYGGRQEQRQLGYEPNREERREPRREPRREEPQVSRQPVQAPQLSRQPVQAPQQLRQPVQADSRMGVSRGSSGVTGFSQSSSGYKGGVRAKY